MADKVIMRAVTTFHGPDGLVVTEGQEFDAAAPEVRSWPTMFVGVDAPADRPVETAAKRSASGGRKAG
jgi:hypothetical protein